MSLLSSHLKGVGLGHLPPHEVHYSEVKCTNSNSYQHYYVELVLVKGVQHVKDDLTYHENSRY
jgi:hypothetical protein